MGWSEFGDALADTLPQLSVGTLLVFGEVGRKTGEGRVLQFVQEESQLIAEVGANEDLAPELQATPEGTDIIRRAGWREPVESIGRDTWWYSLPWPTSSARYRELADMSVIALRDGYGIGEDVAWDYTSWNEENRSMRVRFPGLNLPFRDPLAWLNEH
ncbi:TY-Chap domain-containing protein [Spirillospora sp. CA-255316]